MTKGAQKKSESRRDLFRRLAAGIGAAGMTAAVLAPRPTRAREREREPAAGYRETARVRTAYQAARF